MSDDILERLREVEAYPDKCVRDRILEAAAEITRLRERNAELENTLKLHAGDCMSLSNEIDLMRRNAEDDVEALVSATSRIASLESTVRELREALTTMRDAAQQWCDAVDKDSSWDGWDHHFKAVKWELLPEIASSLASSQSVVKSEGSDV